MNFKDAGVNEQSLLKQRNGCVHGVEGEALSGGRTPLEKQRKMDAM